MTLKKKIGLIFIAIFTALAIILVLIFTLYNLQYELLYYNEIEYYAEEYNLDKALIFSIIKAESNFDKNAKSKKGAIGLMQIMPETFSYMINDENVDSDELYDPNINIYVGTKYLDYLYKKFNNTDLVILAYNAGEGNVRKWLLDETLSKDGSSITIIPFSETRNYYNKVIKYYDNYTEILKKKT